MFRNASLFRPLLPRRETKALQSFNFQRTIPAQLPLKKQDPLTVARDSKTQWAIQRVSVDSDPHQMQLCLPPENPLPYFTLLDAFDFRCEDKRRPIDFVRIGRHQNRAVSILVFARNGVGQLLRDSLSEPIAMASRVAGNTPFRFNFSSHVGYDLRARASIYVCCDNPHALDHINSFMSALHAMTPFNDEAMKHWRILQGEFISRDFTAGELSTQMVAIQPDYDIQGYPRLIPDKHSQVLTFPVEDIVSYPFEIPRLHMAIFMNDLTEIDKVLSQEPMVVARAIYGRNHWGQSAIELACDLGDIETARNIYFAWMSLPSKLKKLHDLFVKCASEIQTEEHKTVNRETREERTVKLNRQFQTLLPGMPFALQAVYFAQFRAQRDYEEFLDSEERPWLALQQACQQSQAADLQRIAASLLPDEYQLFAAVILDDWQGIQDALFDFIPECGRLIPSIENGNWQEADEIITAKIFDDYPELRFAIAQRKKPQSLGLIGALPQTLTRAHGQLRGGAGRYWYLENLKASLRKDIQSMEEVEAKKHCKRVVLDEMRLWHECFEAIKAKDISMLRTLSNRLGIGDTIHDAFRVSGLVLRKNIEGIYNFIFGEHSSGSYKIPLSVLLCHYAMTSNYPAVMAFSQSKLDEIHQARSLYPNLTGVRQALRQKIPARPKTHLDVLAGKQFYIEDLIREQCEFDFFGYRLYQIYLESSQACWRVLQSIPEHEKHMVFYLMPGYSETLEEIIQKFIGKIITGPEDAEKFEKDFQTKMQQLTQCQEEVEATGCRQGDLERFVQCLEGIKKIKLQAMDYIQDEFRRYRAICCCGNEADFVVHTTALASLKAGQALESISSKLTADTFDPISRKVTTVIKNGADKRKYAHILQMNMGKMQDFIKQSLLSFHAQDELGYTPLLLAVISNNLSYVEAFYRMGLYIEKVITRNGAKDGWCYTLLEHAQTPEMVKLLLKYFYDPNETTTLLGRNHLDIDQLLLRYGHKPARDYRLMTLIDKIIKGVVSYERPAEVLQLLLKYQDDYVIEGPYDDCVSSEIASILMDHNKRIDRLKAKLAQRPKIISIEGDGKEITTNYATELGDKSERYRTSMIKVGDLMHDDNKSLVDQLAEIFATNFKMRVNDNQRARIAFFKNYIRTHQDFFIEIFYKNNEPFGFFSFVVKSSHEASERYPEAYNVFYSSLAACKVGAGQNGFVLASQKAVTAAYELSRKQGKPLRFYGRLGQPGLYRKCLPDSAKFSTKYAVDPSLVKHVATGVVGDQLTSKGTSTPPVLSLAEPNPNYALDPQLEDYNELLYADLQCDNSDSLPVVFDVDSPVIEEWRQRLKDSCGFTSQHEEALYQRFSEMLRDRDLHLYKPKL